MRGRGRGGQNGPGGGGRGGGPPNGDMANTRRGSWRGGPPGSSGSHGSSRGASPAMGSASPAPRQSINDHMNDMNKSTDKPKASPKAFATDSDISGAASPGAQRELKPWVADDLPAGASPTNGKANGGAAKDAETFGFGGNGMSNIPWDQFETNARLFGTKTSYQEEIYTTKLNRGGADYKKREKEADRMASEILGQSSSNVHIAEERNHAGQDDAAKGEEEKYSGVLRNPNAYVPPAARRGGAPVPARPNQTGTPPNRANGSTPQATLSPPSSHAPTPMAKTLSAQHMAHPGPPTRSTSDDAQTIDKVGDTRQTGSPQPAAAVSSQAPAINPGEKEDGQAKPSVVDQFRHFVGTEREKVEAKKQTMIKMDRERTLADLKKFQNSFKVPLPMPKDILPLLSKDEERQKSIEAKAASNLESVKARKASADASQGAKSPSGPGSRKISMHIPDIPPFKPKQALVPPKVSLPESAAKDIPQAVSPAPSGTSQASGTVQAKLNPNASAFVFKPNPSAAAFKPGEPSSSISPAAAPAQLPVAGPSSSYKNPFFREPPQYPMTINPRDDFNPWKHDAPVAAASSIQPQWPYTGRKYGSAFMAHPMQGMPMPGFDDDPSSPQSGPPMPMAGMPPNFSPYAYRFAPGMPPQQMPGQMQSNPMFSPGPGYAHLPGGLPPGSQHMQGGPPQSNGMPMYFQNGMPHNPQQFMPPQHMHYNPNTPTRPGPGGPSPNGMNGPMYYTSSLPTPQQTPQMHHNVLHAPPPQPQFSTSPLPPPQIPQ